MGTELCETSCSGLWIGVTTIAGMLRVTKFAAKTIRYHSCDRHDSREEG
jgi:hypothetical protein